LLIGTLLLIDTSEGELMRILIAALLIPLPLMLATAAYAQSSGPAGMGGGSGGHRHGQSAAEKASQSPKADDKAYKDALKTVPNKPYDPWLNTR
jgi:Spy/CpxP family protein refolding chaperone